MIVLDSYAVLALLKGEAGADQVFQLVDGEEETALTALGVAEVVDHLIRLADAEETTPCWTLRKWGSLRRRPSTPPWRCEQACCALATTTGRIEQSASPTALRQRPLGAPGRLLPPPTRTCSTSAAMKASPLFACPSAAGRPGHHKRQPGDGTGVCRRGSAVRCWRPLDAILVRGEVGTRLQSGCS